MLKQVARIAVLSYALLPITSTYTVLAQVTAQTVPPQFMGLIITSSKNPYPTIPFGSLRMWDDKTNWAQIESHPGVFNFSVVDTRLATETLAGHSEVIYTFGAVPYWASSNPL